MTIPPFIEKLTLRNFRSLRDVTVTFANPTFFVGKNASGKSNFIDAFAFLSDCMTRSLTSAIEERRGIRQLGYVFMNPPDLIEFRVDFFLDAEHDEHGHYAFAIEVVDRSDFRVVREQGSLSKQLTPRVWFERTADDFRTNIPGIRPYITPQLLALSIVGGTEIFAPLMQKLTQMHTYALDADVLRFPAGLDSSSGLDKKGADVARMLTRLQNQKRLDRINELVGSVVPALEFLGVQESDDGKRYLIFDQDIGGSMPVVWDASRLSDGTLKVLGLTAAIMQDPAPALIAIEEPEANIHPGALDSIAEQIDIAAQSSQLIITTHSPDLLDTKWIEARHLRVVQWEQGATTISELGSAPVKALQQHLMGAGELLRANALSAALSRMPRAQNIFDELS